MLLYLCLYLVIYLILLVFIYFQLVILVLQVKCRKVNLSNLFN